MKAKKLLLLFLLSTSITGFSATITITASSAGMTFSPNNGNVTISFGDVVHFTLGSIHDAVEVSQSTWNAEGTTPLPGGFQVGFGGDADITNLSVGTHWYVCQAHITMGMRGVITVTALGVNDFQLAKSFTAFPNPATNFVNIKVTDGLFDLPYTIIDEGGRQVSVGKLSDVTTLIDLSSLTSGIYFVQVGEDKKQTFKLIKK